MDQYDNYIQEQKSFLNKLFREKKIEFSEAIGLLGQTLKEGQDACWTCFQTYSHGFELFVIRNKETGKWVGKAKEAFAHPENHVIVVEDWEEGELELSQKYDWLLDQQNKYELGPDWHNQGLLRHSLVQIVGDLDQGLQVYEHLIHFSEWLCTKLMQRDFDFVKNRLYEHGANTWVNFIDEYTRLDKKLGGFETFSVEGASAVYSPEGGDQKIEDEIKLPKGVERNQRRGSVSIHFYSLLTPNGVPMINTELQIDLIRDVDQLLKITAYRFIET